MEEPRRLGDRYELGAVLGRGGMAEVHMARDIRLGRTVAVKTLRTDLSRDPTFLARFRREAQSAASLNHPSIVAVFDTGEDYVGGTPVPYIIMEYVDGSTLRDLLHSGRQLLPERAMEITAGVLQALEYSHRHGIVHRDIKPANVMLTREGNVKVMDFGIARAVADNGMTMTQTAAVIGTAQYLSPEQAKGETVDARSDLYSTGCLLYELLTGRPPFIGDSPVAVAYQHVREDPQPPSVFDPDLSVSIDAIVLKSLAKTRDDRYQSADEMRADLERALDGRPVGAPPPMGAFAPTERIDPQTAGLSQQTASYAAPTAAFSAPEYGGGGDYDGDDPPRSRRAGKNGKGGRAGYIVLIVACVAALVAAGVVAYALFDKGSGSQQGVPDIRSMTPAKAAQLAQQYGFTAQDGNCAKSDKTVPQGQILSQTPGPNASAKQHSVITYCLSSGAPLINVSSSYKNQSATSVQQDLQKAGFSNVTTQNQNSSLPQGETIDVQVGGKSVLGKSIPSSSTVVILESAGQQTKAVPNVANESAAQAEQALENAGFTYTLGNQNSSTVAAGDVISTNPPAGSQEPPGTQIELNISQGPQQPTSPPSSSGPPSTTPSSPGQPTTPCGPLGCFPTGGGGKHGGNDDD